MNRNRQDKTPHLLRISFTLNGKPVDIEVRPWDTALMVLRDQLGLTNQGRLWHR